LIRKENAVKKWFEAFGRIGARKGNHTDPAQPIQAPRATETEKEKGQRQDRAVSAPKNCEVCGGALVTKVLNSWCDPSTDVITPADTTQTCAECGKVVMTTMLPRGY
jgi:hypothetical protein